MHEIGHIILGHLVEFSETALNRGGITSKQYGVLEIEAHYFAAEFLMPTAILKYYPKITVNEIALLFGVSEEAAEKKYNRVFNNNYLPAGEYDTKIMRNFFKFLITEADEAIYRSIYRTWGLPWKEQYVSVCRTCPECYSYIDDPNATYCSYCGSQIERFEMYRTMHDRMEARRKFTKKQGTKHHWYPFSEPFIANNLNYALYNSDWCDYDYWEFAKYMMYGKKSSVSMDLQSAILYSHAFADDNDDLYILTDTALAANVINSEQKTVLSYLKKTDNIERSRLEVLVAHDL